MRNPQATKKLIPTKGAAIEKNSPIKAVASNPSGRFIITTTWSLLS